MTYSDDVTAPDQAIRSGEDQDFESADLYSDDEYEIEYDDEEDGPEEEEDDDEDDDDEDDDDEDSEEDEEDAVHLQGSW
jgi:hypothetical protein